MRASSLILRVSFTYCSTVIKTTAASIEAPTYDEERERVWTGKYRESRRAGPSRNDPIPNGGCMKISSKFETVQRNLLRWFQAQNKRDASHADPERPFLLGEA